MDGVVGELECPVCLELFETPIILPCSHVLCRTPCAERLFEDEEVIRCPVCRDRSMITGGLESLPRVISLEHIIERYRNSEIPRPPPEEEEPVEIAGPEDIPCQLCEEEPPTKAAKSCLDCNASYCQKCIKISHPNKEPFSEHQLVQPRRYPKPREQRCPMHDMKVNIFCQSCKKLGCLLCADDVNSHQGHQVLSLAQAVGAMRAEVELNVRAVESSLDILGEVIKDHQTTFQGFQKEMHDKKSDVNDQCDGLIAEIETRRSFFLSDLEYEEKGKQEGHDEVMQEYETKNVNLQSLIHYAREVLKEEDECCFIQLAKNVNEKMSKSVLTCSDLIPATPVPLNHKVVDLRKEKAILKDMQYLCVPSTPAINVEKCSRSTRSVVVVLCPPALDDVIDGYLVYYSSEVQRSQGKRVEQMVFKAPHEERKIGSRPQPAVCLIHSNLEVNTQYNFSVRAYNRSGKSELSTTVNCRTLSVSQTTIKVPEILEDQCRMYTHSINIYSISPTECPQDGSVCHYLLYREASADQIWKSVSMFGRCDHRVFGLESDTRYDFVVMACDKTGECQVSNKVTFKSERAAY